MPVFNRLNFVLQITCCLQIPCADTTYVSMLQATKAKGKENSGCKRVDVDDEGKEKVPEDPAGPAI